MGPHSGGGAALPHLAHLQAIEPKARGITDTSQQETKSQGLGLAYCRRFETPMFYHLTLASLVLDCCLSVFSQPAQVSPHVIRRSSTSPGYPSQFQSEHSPTFFHLLYSHLWNQLTHCVCCIVPLHPAIQECCPRSPHYPTLQSYHC